MTFVAIFASGFLIGVGVALYVAATISMSSRYEK